MRNDHFSTSSVPIPLHKFNEFKIIDIWVAPLKRNGYPFRGDNFYKFCLSPFWKWVYSKPKESATQFIPFQVDRFSEGHGYAEKQTGSHESEKVPLKRIVIIYIYANNGVQDQPVWIYSSSVFTFRDFWRFCTRTAKFTRSWNNNVITVSCACWENYFVLTCVKGFFVVFFISWRFSLHLYGLEFRSYYVKFSMLTFL